MRRHTREDILSLLVNAYRTSEVIPKQEDMIYNARRVLTINWIGWNLDIRSHNFFFNLHGMVHGILSGSLSTLTQILVLNTVVLLNAKCWKQAMPKRLEGFWGTHQENIAMNRQLVEIRKIQVILLRFQVEMWARLLETGGKVILSGKEL